MRRIALFIFFLFILAKVSFAAVTKNMETLAKALYANSSGNVTYTFSKVSVIETGKNLGRGTPVKFRMIGIKGFKRQSDPPPGWNRDSFPIWVGDTIEAEARFNDVFVVYYSKDEFGKTVACAGTCISEENIRQHQQSLADMRAQHARAMKQNLELEASIKQRQQEQAEQQLAAANHEQRKMDARVVTEVIGKYGTCVDSWFGPPGTGTAILTDVNVSYIHDYRNEEPYKFEVIFWFDNIVSYERDGNILRFELKNRVFMRPGDEAFNIGFSDSGVMDKFYDDFYEAKSTWDEKHPDLR